jgi:hypothetical protein
VFQFKVKSIEKCVHSVKNSIEILKPKELSNRRESIRQTASSLESTKCPKYVKMRKKFILFILCLCRTRQRRWKKIAFCIQVKSKTKPTTTKRNPLTQP